MRPSTPEPNKRTKPSLFLDPDHIFSRPPFSDEEAVEIITDSAVDALVRELERPMPQSDVAEAIRIVRMQVDFISGVGILDALTTRNVVHALETHERFLDSLHDADAYPIDALQPSSSSSSATKSMDIGAHYYNFRNVNRREQLDQLGPLNALNIFTLSDWAGSLLQYYFTVQSGRYSTAATIVFSIAALGLIGPIVLEGLRSFGLPSWLTSGLLDEYNILRRLQEDPTVRGFDVPGLRRFMLEGQPLLDQVIETRRFRATYPGNRHGSTVGISPSEVASYSTTIASIARGLYRGSIGYKVGAVATLVAGIMADIYFRYKPDRCRLWLRRNGDETRKEWRGELETTTNELQLFVAFRDDFFHEARDLEEASEAWARLVDGLVNGQNDAAIDRLSDPCALVERIRPHLAVFQRIEDFLKAAPYNVDEGFIEVVQRFDARKGAFDQSVSLPVPAEADVRIRQRMVDLHDRMKAYFYRNPGGNLNRMENDALSVVSEDLNSLIGLLNRFLRQAGLNAGYMNALERLEQKYPPSPDEPLQNGDAVVVPGIEDPGEDDDEDDAGAGIALQATPLERRRSEAELLRDDSSQRTRRQRTRSAVDDLVDAFLATRFAK